MKERVIDIVCELVGVERSVVRGDKDLLLYGVTSAIAAELVAECEDAFGVSVDPADFPKLRTIDQLVAYLEARRKP